MRFISILFFLLFNLSWISGEESFGYISHSTINIGDDIQSIAAKQFLPPNSIAIDREFINEFDHHTKVNAVVSGWFMHEKNTYWDLPLVPPEVSWPPSPAIKPFFISLHLTGTFLPTIFSKENINYLKKHAPVGARDLFTLRELKIRGIPCYFSGCLTLTLNRKFNERNNLIYLVDLDEETIAYIKSKTASPIVVLTHGRPLLQMLEVEHRLKYAERLLEFYQTCKCVVTTRLHATMPCLAYGTPVLMISSDSRVGINSRFTGLLEHTRHCSKEELVNGEVDYDFDNPPENPNTHLPMRENLIKMMQEWVQNTTNEVNRL